jgi:HEAT repeat protein
VVTPDRADAARAEASRRRLAEQGYPTPEDLRRAVRSDGHVGVRAEAAFVLGELGEAAAAGDLADAARGDDAARVRAEAALALGRLGDTQAALPVLREELGGAFFADAPLRAAKGLALLGHAEGWPRVAAALGSDQPAERLEAVYAVPAFGPLAGTEVEGTTVDPEGALRRAAGDAEPLVARAARERLEDSA